MQTSIQLTYPKASETALKAAIETLDFKKELSHSLSGDYIIKSKETTKPAVHIFIAERTEMNGIIQSYFPEKQHLAYLSDGSNIPQVNEQHKIHTLSHLGVQYQRVNKNSLDTMAQHRILRLGQLSQQQSRIEPMIRECDGLWLDSSVLSYSSCLEDALSPFGISSLLACQINHYAGESPHCNTIFLSCDHSSLSNQLIMSSFAAFIWYYSNALELRENVAFEQINTNMDHYVVELDETSLEFYRSVRSNKWWVKSELLNVPGQKIPCTEEAYLTAIQNKIPEELLIRL